MKTIFFHEDDHSQIELIPEQNKLYCLEQFNAIEQSYTQSSDPSLAQLHVRESTQAELESLNISFTEIDTFLSSKLCKFDKVVTGYGNAKIVCPSVYAYGCETTGVIFIECSKDKIVSSIWFSDALLEIPQVFKNKGLIFVDWAWTILCDVDDHQEYANYVNEKNKVIQKRSDILKQKIKAKAAEPWWKFW